MREGADMRQKAARGGGGGILFGAPQMQSSKTQETISSQPERPIVSGQERGRNVAAAAAASERMRLRSKRLSWCMFCLVGAVSCLAPFLSLHATQRVGFLLFESDLLQMRASLFTVIATLFGLVILVSIIVIYLNHQNRRRRRRHSSATASSNSLLIFLQRCLRQLIGALALVSVFSYLSLTLIVPQIRQIRRMPLATFDCEANQIIIENCAQQFASHAHSEQSLLDTVGQLLVGDLNGNSERLIKKLNCFRYNAHPGAAPTRFLLHDCGLVCKPDKQQLTQFSDDLNQRDKPPPPLAAVNQQDTTDVNQKRRVLGLQAPYSQAPEESSRVPSVELVRLRVCFSGEQNVGSASYQRFCVENLTGTAQQAAAVTTSGGRRVASRQHQSINRHQSALTVGQLNALLSKLTPNEQSKQETKSNFQHEGEETNSAVEREILVEKRNSKQTASTHYVNPIVQFESHFKNWPHLTRATTSTLSDPFGTSGGGGKPSLATGYDDEFFHHQQPPGRDKFADEDEADEEEWCKLRPIPPFIVNNKPFSDIQCSLEHDYIMSTDPRRRYESPPPPPPPPPTSPIFVSQSDPSEHQIYLKKWTNQESSKEQQQIQRLSEGYSRNERCNIQCRVNLLYQVHLTTETNYNSRATNLRGDGLGDDGAEFSGQKSRSYYLPTRSCLIVLAPGDKSVTSRYYLVFRSLADSSLLLAILLIDLLLLLETMDTKQFQFEAKKSRLISLLLALTLMPICVAFFFDSIAFWVSASTNTDRDDSVTNNKVRSREGYLMSFINDQLIPTLSNYFSRLESFVFAVLGSSKNNTNHKSQWVERDPASKAIANSSTHQMAFNATLKAQQQQQTRVVVDNYLVPFLVYALLMFVFAINSFKLPLVESREEPLVRASSIEELGLVSSKRRQLPPASSSPSPASPSARDKESQIIPPAGTTALAQRRHSMRAASFAALTLFMGLQFHLSQLTQSQILIDSFSLHRGLSEVQYQQQDANQNHHQPQPWQASVGTFWFALATHSSGAMILLLLALVFSDETSAFLADFSPFKPIHETATSTAVASTDNHHHRQLVASGRRQNEATFRKYLAVSLLIYAFRFLLLANIQANSKMRWPLVFVFQLLESFNFPLTWFALTWRAHQLCAEQSSEFASAQRATDGERRMRALTGHILVQSALGFVYFVFARFVAYFVHSLHASLHLHSDNIDWFITNFNNQEEGSSSSDWQQTYQAAADKSATNSSRTGGGPLPSPPPLDALFSPLPDERQTYLHASRLFVKYNSLVCSLLGLLILAAFFYSRYHIWLDHKRTREKTRQLATSELSEEAENELIGARLQLDLRNLHASSGDECSPDLARQQHAIGRCSSSAGQRPPVATVHVPKTRKQLAADNEAERPRARIHYRYELNRKPDRSRQRVPSHHYHRRHEPSLSSETSEEYPLERPDDDGASPPAGKYFHSPARKISSTFKETKLQHRNSFEEVDEEVDEFGTVERRTQSSFKSKRVRILEDGENWSLVVPQEFASSPTNDGNGLGRNRSMASESAANSLSPSQPHPLLPPPSQFPDAPEVMKSRTEVNKTTPRRITFAPTATLIREPATPQSPSAHINRADGAGPASGAKASEHRCQVAFMRRASPEPSIDGKQDDDDDDNNGQVSEADSME